MQKNGAKRDREIKREKEETRCRDKKPFFSFAAVHLTRKTFEKATYDILGERRLVGKKEEGRGFQQNFFSKKWKKPYKYTQINFRFKLLLNRILQ